MFCVTWIIPQRALIWDMAFPFHYFSFYTILSCLSPCPHIEQLVCANLLITEARLPLFYFSFGLNWLLQKLTFQRTVRVAIKKNRPTWVSFKWASSTSAHNMWEFFQQGEKWQSLTSQVFIQLVWATQHDFLGLNLFVPERKKRKRVETSCTPRVQEP